MLLGLLISVIITDNLCKFLLIMSFCDLITTTFSGLSESELAKLEMVTLLCMGDKTHSQLMECMPEKCGSAAQSRDFESVLSKVCEISFCNALILFQ